MKWEWYVRKKAHNPETPFWQDVETRVCNSHCTMRQKFDVSIQDWLGTCHQGSDRRKEGIIDRPYSCQLVRHAPTQRIFWSGMADQKYGDE
jgi:hypothetical protein